MFSTIPFALALSSFLTATHAAPARTHCRCTIISPSPLLTQQETDLLSTTSAGSADLCTNLGWELEYLRSEDPDLYSSYINPGNPEVAPTATEDVVNGPMPTTILMELAARYGDLNFLGVEFSGGKSSKSPSRSNGGNERIVCHGEPRFSSAYKASALGLWVLHAIVACAVLACLYEASALAFTWYTRKQQQGQRLQLSGDEKSLKAHSIADVLKDSAYLDEKRWTGDAHVVQIRAEGCEEDNDDEMDRPVL
ncbi:hypothetical protein BU24DRAFT_417417 [Aaosphaeria arxii CBS 175.79]|uniref:Uncharacterized protein n=1 Tax=Aaosphaeria arxii CBS 175.79 TaxID=1450172 RepID=A0A6A5YB23_9PLEO|nr:uncharacterized protein BU24DRAFT_417417 [Aaosphaeria arxii CBS 175.79]KAF2021794.1 hypothetical protein BU24DRAFT_417417 [Aaosphaeria arxii CBS 175.79]